MKKMTKALLPACSLLVAGILALTGVTYAWFVTSPKGNVSQFEASVVNAEGIEMSWNASLWKSTIALDDTEYSNQTNSKFYENKAVAFTYEPVSTNGVVTSGKLSFFEATVKDDKITEIKAVDHSGENTKGYVHFNIYFRTAQDQTLYLDPANTAVTGDKTIGLASRVAFINQGVATDGKAVTATGLNTGTTSVIWEPNANSHTPNGIADKPASVSAENADNAKYTYFGIKAIGSNLSLDRKEANYTYLGAVTTLQNIPTTEGSTDDLVMIDLKAGINKVSVYIWVEGQDADCLNDLAGSTLTVKLGFTTEKPVATSDTSTGDGTQE